MCVSRGVDAVLIKYFAVRLGRAKHLISSSCLYYYLQLMINFKK